METKKIPDDHVKIIAKVLSMTLHFKLNHYDELVIRNFLDDLNLSEDLELIIRRKR